MVSPAPSASQKPPVLSYADRAKKARNISSQPLPATRTQLQTASVPSVMIAPTVSNIVPHPIPEPDTPKISPAGNTHHRLSQQVQSTGSSADAEPTPNDLTEAVPQHVTSSPAISSDHTQRPVAAPAVNVWHLRKEQMAQARANSRSQTHQSPQTSRFQASQEPGSSRASEASSTTSNGATNAEPVFSQRQDMNGNGTDSSHGKTPSTTQRLRGSVPPAVDDATSWPMVGMSVNAPTAQQRPPSNDTAASVEGKGSKADEQRGDDQNTGVTTKKSASRLFSFHLTTWCAPACAGVLPYNWRFYVHRPQVSYAVHYVGEKPRWVQIPREELQAAVDEHRPRSSQRSAGRSRSRPSQQHNQIKTPPSSKPAPGSPSNTGSASGQNSQGQSRTHSAAGTRPQQSHSSSVSHSQAASRVGSVQSSPRQQSSSRGARRLPEDGSILNVDPVSLQNRSMRSSRAPSPQTAGHSLQATDASVSAVSDATNVRRQLSGVMDHLRPYPEPSHSHGEPYYPIVPPPLSASNSQPHSYHSTHASNSPIASSYALPLVAQPSNIYPSPPPHMPGYAGTPPYPMYPPYTFPQYGQPQPYVPWTTSAQGYGPNLYPVSSQYHHSHSPSNQSGYSPASMVLANASRVLQQHEGMPPPTKMSRPPPPGQSEGVAGYREVGFFSPSPTAHSVAAEGSEPDAGASRGRQSREFSFGTIKRTVTNKTPSPPPVSNRDSGRDDRTGDSAGPEMEDAEQEGDHEGEKAFPVFSIGIIPGEAGPSRMRSKTHPKSAGTSHERGNTAPARLEPSYSKGDEGVLNSTRGLTEDPKDAEGSVQVIDLTDSVLLTWEFGTTKQSSGDDTKLGEPVSSEPYRPLSHLNGIKDVRTHSEGQTSITSTVPSADTTSSLPSIPRPSQYTSRMHVPPLSVGMPNGVPAPAAHSPSVTNPQSGVSMVSPSVEKRANDEWEVKNFGFGFGRGSNGLPLAPPGGRIDRERDFSPREFNSARSRRGSYGGGYGYDRGSTHERGGYAGRRGRGINGTYSGRGYGGRNAPRGGYQQGQSPRPPFTITQQPAVNSIDHGYYVPPPPQGTTYFHPLGYDYAAYSYAPMPMTTPTTNQSAPPVPSPQSLISFPLDPTRYYLLGQLEYYLSAQNLAQDFYLRQRVSDSKLCL